MEFVICKGASHCIQRDVEVVVEVTLANIATFCYGRIRGCYERLSPDTLLFSRDLRSVYMPLDVVVRRS